MRVEIQLVGSPQRWVLERGPVHIGRGQECEVELPPEQFPGVSREHARLQWQGAELRLSDCKSGNGTYVNGKRIEEAKLAVGDTVRLGPEGPELLIRLQGEAAVASGAAPLEASTLRVAAAAGAEFGATMRVAPAGGGAAPPGPARPTIRPGTAAPAPRQASEAPPRPPTTAAPSPGGERFTAERSMVEMKLATLQRLVGLALALCLLLLGAVLYVSQQLADTRADLARMRGEALAVAQHVAPTLTRDQQQLQGMDARLAEQEKAAEDHFVQRMNQELPAMIDRYMDQKMKQYGLPKPPG